MYKIATLIFCTTLLCLGVSVKAQPNKVINVKEKLAGLRTKLKMNDTEFIQFMHRLSMYNDSTILILKNSTFSREERIKAFDKITSNRNSYLHQSLSSQSYTAFVEYEQDWHTQSNNAKKYRVKTKN